MKELGIILGGVVALIILLVGSVAYASSFGTSLEQRWIAENRCEEAAKMAGYKDYYEDTKISAWASRLDHCTVTTRDGKRHLLTFEKVE